MILRKLFEHVDCGRDGAPLAVFHRLGQIHAIEQNVAQLLRRAHVKFHPRNFVNFFRLGRALAFQFARHLRKRGRVDFDSGLLHTRQHRNQRQIYLFVKLTQPSLFHFAAQGASQPAGKVGGLGEFLGHLQVETPQSNVCQPVR